jgi:hypothetical protein
MDLEKTKGTRVNGSRGNKSGIRPRGGGKSPEGAKESHQRHTFLPSLQGSTLFVHAPAVCLDHPWLLSCGPTGASFGFFLTTFGSVMAGYRRQAAACVLLLLCFAAAPAVTAAERDGRWAVLLAGASGDPDLQNMYLKEIEDLYAVLESRLGFPRDQIVVLFDDPSRNSALIRHKSTREGLLGVCRDLAARVEKDDLLFVFLEGHGAYDEKSQMAWWVRSDGHGAAMLDSIPAQRSVVINATNCSGGSLPALSRKGRIVVTATKSGMEKNQTHAGRYFVEALKSESADSDKNGRVSVMEAFSYANQKVAEHYKSEGNLQTEHSALDDNGDGQAQDKPDPENGDGLLARTTFLGRVAMPVARGEQTPEQQALAREVQELEKQVEALKYAKGEMPEEDYETKLEELLLRLARVNAKLRK